MAKLHRNLKAARKAKGLLTEEERFTHHSTALEIEGLLLKETEDVVKIGRLLASVQDAFRDKSGGKWLAWLNEELNSLSVNTAGNYMRASRFCDEYRFTNFVNLPSITALL